jgi:hypothetical protein
MYAVYTSEYKTQVCMTDSFFSETIIDTTGSEFKQVYITEFKIIKCEKKELFLLKEKLD